MKSEAERDREVLAGMKKNARTERRCDAARSFTLADRSTALVSCQLSPKHRVQHQRIQKMPDGATVTFRWA